MDFKEKYDKGTTNNYGIGVTFNAFNFGIKQVLFSLENLIKASVG